MRRSGRTTSQAPYRRGSRRGSRRGMALMLVLLVLGITVVVGSVFLNAATTTTSLARGVQANARARMIAEGGLAIGLRYIQKDPNWRKVRTNGLWLENQPLDGGTFTLYGQDGNTVSADGTVVGDGNLADDRDEPIVLTCVGVFGEARSQVRVVATPQANSTVAVTQRIELRANSLVDSYSSVAGPYGGTNVGQDAVLSSNEISKPAVTLRNYARVNGNVMIGPGGVASEGVVKHDSSVINGSVVSLAAQIDTPLAVAPTLPPGAGPKAITSGTSVVRGNERVDSLRVAGTGVLNVRGVASFVVDGDVSIGENAVIKLGGPVTYAVAVQNLLEVLDTAMIDSYDSSAGAYGGSNAASNAVVATNSSANNSVWVTLATVRGDVLAPPAADPTKVIKVQGGTITGARGNMAQAIAFPAVASVPVGMPANQGNYSRSSGTTVISSNLQVDDLTIDGTAVVQISGHRTIVVNKNFVVDGTARLDVLAGSSLKVYVGAQCDFKTSAKLNATTKNPSSLIIFGRGAGVMHNVRNLSEVYALFDAPASSVTITDSAQFYGSVVAQSAKLSLLARLHHDQNPAVAAANPRMPLAWPTGRLTIYSRGRTTVDGNALVNTGSSLDPLGVEFAQLNDYPITLAGAAQVQGVVTAPDSLFTAKGTSRFTGKVRASDVVLDESAQTTGDGTSQPAVFADQSIEMKQNAVAGTTAGSMAVGVNRIGGAVIVLRGSSTLKGDALAGPDGEPAKDVVVHGGASLTGVAESLTKDVNIVLPTRPNVPGSASARVYSGGSVTVLSADLDCSDFVVTDDATVEVSGNVKVNASGAFRVTKNGKLVVRDGSRLTVYFGSTTDINDYAKLNLDGDPNALVLNYYGTADVNVEKSAGVCATVVAPGALMRVEGQANFYGTFKGKRLQVSGGVHFDVSGTPKVRWIEQ